MMEDSDTSHENEIHRIDSPFNEDFKNIDLFAKERRPENLWEMEKTMNSIVI